MAEVTRDRAQLILVTGLVIAVLFVAFALLVNTAIYTENVATRGGESGGDALEYRAAAVSTVGGLIDAENADDESGRDVIQKEGLPAVNESLEEQFARRGTATNLSFNSRTDGFVVLQDEPRNFTDRNADPNYTVVEDVDATRGFAFEIDPDETTSDPSPTGDAFHVVLNETGSATNESRYYVYEDSGDVVVRLEVEDEDGTETFECSVAHGGENVTVDLTAAVLESPQERSDCRDFQWPDTYDDIEYRNGDEAFGTYRVTLDALESDVEIPLLGDLGLTDPDGPYVLEAVYSVRVDLRYDSPAIGYETTVRIAPGEPDG